jgi:hypothetical protein
MVQEARLSSGQDDRVGGGVKFVSQGHQKPRFANVVFFSLIYEDTMTQFLRLHSF